MADLERIARTIAALHGGKIIFRGETRAFQVGRAEGWWKYGRGANNGDCVWEFQERHWPDYLNQAQMVHS